MSGGLPYAPFINKIKYITKCTLLFLIGFIAHYMLSTTDPKVESLLPPGGKVGFFFLIYGFPESPLSFYEDHLNI